MGVAVDDERVRQIGLWTIPILLGLYAAPLYALAVNAIFNGLTGQSFIGKWFVSLIAAPDAALNLFHKVLMPITAGVTVAALWKGQNGRWTRWMVIALLLTIVLSIWFSVTFGISDVQNNMFQSADIEAVATRAQFFTLAGSYLGKFQESLTTYLLILFGLQAIPKQQQG
jgi:hypothetical protein